MESTVTTPAPSKKRNRNRWLEFGIRRGRRLVISLWVLVTATFLMVHLIPGDPVRTALGQTAPQELVDVMREQLGLNDPLIVQYLNYLGGLFTGDFGISMVTNVPVTQIISDRLPATLQIAAVAFVVTMVLSVPLGVLMAKLTHGGRNQKVETGFTSTGIVLSAIPDYIVAIVLVYIFAVSLGVLPVAGRSDASSFVIPVIALALGAIFFIARLIRIDMLKVLNMDFIRAARSKRISERLVYFRHALPNAVTATLTVSGLVLGSLIAGTVIVETVMAWPGLGTTMVESILNKNLPVIQGVILTYGVMILVINLAVDVLIALFDPRTTVLDR